MNYSVDWDSKGERDWEPLRVRCRCVACGAISIQETVDSEDRGRTLKTWFCGCKPAPSQS